MPETIRVIFFDLGDTLGSAVLSPPPVHLVAFDAYPFVKTGGACRPSSEPRQAPP